MLLTMKYLFVNNHEYDKENQIAPFFQHIRLTAAYNFVISFPSTEFIFLSKDISSFEIVILSSDFPETFHMYALPSTDFKEVAIQISTPVTQDFNHLVVCRYQSFFFR